MGLLSKVLRNAEGGKFLFWCPGCENAHAVGEGWTFNGDVDKPTFSPSIKIEYAHGNPLRKFVCHSVVTNGTIRYYDDTTHKLRGKTLELPPWRQS